MYATQRLSSNATSHLLHIIRVKHQRPHLDTLPRLLVLKRRVDERTMRHAPRPTISLAIEALNQHHFVGGLLAQVEPAVRVIRPHGERLAHAVRIDQLHGHEVSLGHGRGVHHAQGVLPDRLDRPPHVDDLISAAQQAICVFGDVVADAVGPGFVGLIDVHALDGPAVQGGFGSWRFGGAGDVLALSTDGVVEDEDLRCAGARGDGVLVREYVEYHFPPFYTALSLSLFLSGTA